MPKRISKARQLTKDKKETWKKAVKEKWDNKCALCCKTENLDCHHLTYRKELKYNPVIGVLVCKSCHKLGHSSFHKGGLEGYSKFIKMYPELFKQVIELIEEI